MSYSVTEFANRLRAQIDAFEQAWVDEHKVFPDDYPLELSDDDKGLWMEFFTEYVSNLEERDDDGN